MRKNLFIATVIVLLALMVSHVRTKTVLAQDSVDLVVHYVMGMLNSEQIGYDVKAFVSVVDSEGNPIKDLKADNFSITEDSRKVDIITSEFASDYSTNLVLVLDTSERMVGADIAATKAAISNFIDSLKEDDRVAIITYDNSPKLIVNFTSNHNELLDKLSSVEAIHGSSNCSYDATYQAIQIASALPSGRPVVVLFTGSEDETSSGDRCSIHTLDDVIDIATESGTGTPIYTLGMGSRINTFTTLKRLADLTGGRYLYSPYSAQLDSTIKSLSSLLSSQYTLTYKSASGPGAHTLTVSANYLTAQDTDTRNFLLPPLPTSVIFVTPREGESVNGLVHVVVSLSGQGETVNRIVFEINGEVVGVDDTPPYETEIDFSSFSPGRVEIVGIAQDGNGNELARESVSIVNIAPTPTPMIISPSYDPPIMRIMRIYGGGIVFGLTMLVILVAINNFRSKSKTKKKAELFEISIAYPKLQSKRLESIFLIQFFLPKYRSQVEKNIQTEFSEKKFSEQTKESKINIGDRIKVKLSNPSFRFTDPVKKSVTENINKFVFLCLPNDDCEPGFHKILISISDADTDQELESYAMNIQVVDFAFDHVSRPVLSKVSAIVLGIGSFAMFILTSLEQIDKTVGLTSGSAAGVMALGIYASFYNLYQRVRPNTP